MRKIAIMGLIALGVLLYPSQTFAQSYTMSTSETQSNLTIGGTLTQNVTSTINGTTTINSGAVFNKSAGTTNGTVNLGGTLNYTAGNIAATVNLNGGRVDQGTLAGTLTNANVNYNGVFYQNGGTVTTLSVNNGGTFTQSGGTVTTVTVDSGGVFGSTATSTGVNNGNAQLNHSAEMTVYRKTGGTLNLQNDAVFEAFGNTTHNTASISALSGSKITFGGSLNNAGALTNNGGEMYVKGGLTNTGTVALTSSYLEVNGASTIGTINNIDSIYVANSGTSTITNYNNNSSTNSRFGIGLGNASSGSVNINFYGSSKDLEFSFNDMATSNNTANDYHIATLHTRANTNIENERIDHRLAGYMLDVDHVGATYEYHLNKVGNASYVDAAVQTNETAVLLVNVAANSMQKRVGELMWLDGTMLDHNNNAVWARTFGRSAEYKDTEYDTMGFEIGYDRKLNKNFYVGGLAHFSTADTDTNMYGKKTSADSNSYGFGLYGIYLSDTGWYADVVGRFLYMDQDISSQGLTDDYSWGRGAFVLGFEGGKEIQLDNGFFITPRAELGLQYIGSDTASTSLGDVTADSSFAFTAEVGAMAGKTIDTSFGEVKPYVKMNLIAVSSNAETDFDFISEKESVNVVKAELGGGASMRVSNDLFAYADLGLQFGNKDYKEVNGTIGVRYAFGNSNGSKKSTSAVKNSYAANNSTSSSYTANNSSSEYTSQQSNTSSSSNGSASSSSADSAENTAYAADKSYNNQSYSNQSGTSTANNNSYAAADTSSSSSSVSAASSSDSAYAMATENTDDSMIIDGYLFGISEVPAKHKGDIKEFAENAKDYNVVYVIGHADSMGTDAGNRKMSMDRAAAVVNMLVEEGVPFENIRTVVMGASAPVASNATEDGRAQNRRVEISVKNNAIGMDSASDAMVVPEFDYGVSALPAKYKSELQEFAAKIVDMDYSTVYVSGHADSAGTNKGNYKVSMDRALEVAEFLVKEGVPHTKIMMIVNGATVPVESNSTETGRAQNRRVEVGVI